MKWNETWLLASVALIVTVVVVFTVVTTAGSVLCWIGGGEWSATLDGNRECVYEAAE